MVGIEERIAALKKERNALILAHNYCLPEVQDIADHVGDSLGLSVIASETDADVIVFCGVSFMAESAKILSPSKTVLIPEPDAECPMASMCTAQQLRDERRRDPDRTIVGYVNSTAAAKAEMDICCTSSNALRAVASLEGDDVLFVPDRNLGAYVAANVDKDVRLWDGYCPTHQAITPEVITRMREEHPGAVVLAHPECRMSVLDLADHVGSTERMFALTRELDAEEFIVATEAGMRYRLESASPGKRFHFPHMALCPVMKMTSLDSVLRALERMDSRVVLDEETLRRASVPLRRMIAIK